MKVKKIVLTLFLSVIAVILSVVALLNVNANKPTFASTITSLVDILASILTLQVIN